MSTGSPLPDLPEKSYLYSFSALDRYFGHPPGLNLFVVTEASLVDIAKHTDTIRYPGVDFADAAVPNGKGSIFFRCVDSARKAPFSPFPVLNLLYDPHGNKFIDPFSVYWILRSRKLRIDGFEPHIPLPVLSNTTGGWQTAVEAALLVSKYEYELVEDVAALLPSGVDPSQPLSTMEQRHFLTSLLRSASPWRGLDLLMKTGFIGVHWPELQAINMVDHSKEYHPEGNGWEHTLETFKYRKVPDLALSLALLLHDCGKPQAEQAEGRAFDGHAQIGSVIARKFLERLEFPAELIREVCYLVAQHMLPAYLPKLPVYRTARQMDSPYFPKLLELYRCDLSSSYKGPDDYYQACKTFRAFLRNRRNPHRSADGKKLVRLYVE